MFSFTPETICFVLMDGGYMPVNRTCVICDKNGLSTHCADCLSVPGTTPSDAARSRFTRLIAESCLLTRKGRHNGRH